VPSEQEYNATVTMLQGSPRARTEVLDMCVKQMSATDATWHHNAAVVMNVSEKDAPRVACSRYLKALVSGRATYQDTVDLKNRRYTSKLVKIFQGR